MDFLLLCLVFRSKRGAVGTGRRADVGGELQQRGGGGGGDVHVVAVLLPSTSTRYPRPPQLRSTSTSDLGPHLGSKLHRYPQTLALPSPSTSTQDLLIHPLASRN